MDGAPTPPYLKHGHPYFYELCEVVQILHNNKNRDYAHGGSPLGNFERVSQIMKLYPQICWETPEGVAIIYMFKQLDAYLWMKNRRHDSVTGEGVLERLKDILVYSGILSCIERDKADATLSRNHEPETTPAECDNLHEHSVGKRPSTTVHSEREGQGHLGTTYDPIGRHDNLRPPTPPSGAPLGNPPGSGCGDRRR